MYTVLSYRPETTPAKVNNLFKALCLIGGKLSKSFLKQNCDSCYDTDPFSCRKSRFLSLSVKNMAETTVRCCDFGGSITPCFDLSSSEFEAKGSDDAPKKRPPQIHCCP